MDAVVWNYIHLSLSLYILKLMTANILIILSTVISTDELYFVTEEFYSPLNNQTR